MSKMQDERSHRFSQLIGLELKASFARHETSQAEVAEKLGHSKSGYSRWLNAKPSMPIEALLNTCELIGVDPRDVFNAAYRRLVEELGEYQPSRPSVDLSEPSGISDEAVDEEERLALAVRLANQADYDKAALRSKYKQQYIDGDSRQD